MFRLSSRKPKNCCVFSSFPARSVVRKEVLAAEERNCDWALTWWALADIPEPATPKGEFRMSYSTKQAIYYGEVNYRVLQLDWTSCIACQFLSLSGEAVPDFAISATAWKTCAF